MNKKDCKDCLYEEEMRLYVREGGIIWASSDPFPCSECIRCPHPRPSLVDNYRKCVVMKTRE